MTPRERILELIGGVIGVLAVFGIPLAFLIIFGGQP